MARWNKADIPHKGWRYIGIEDLGEDVYPGEEIKYEERVKMQQLLQQIFHETEYENKMTEIQDMVETTKSPKIVYLNSLCRNYCTLNGAIIMLEIGTFDLTFVFT